MRPIDRPVIWHTPVQRPLLSHTPASRAHEASGSKHWQAPPLQNSTQNSPRTVAIVVASHNIIIIIKLNRRELPPNIIELPMPIDRVMSLPSCHHGVRRQHTVLITTIGIDSPASPAIAARTQGVSNRVNDSA
jgi:hypothetical protein